jgi:hypothetical protein
VLEIIICSLLVIIALLELKASQASTAVSTTFEAAKNAFDARDVAGGETRRVRKGRDATQSGSGWYAVKLNM